MPALVVFNVVKSRPPLLNLGLSLCFPLFSLTIPIILITFLVLFISRDARGAGHRRHFTIQNFFLECNEIRLEKFLHRIAFGYSSLLEGVEVRNSIRTPTIGHYR